MIPPEPLYWAYNYITKNKCIQLLLDKNPRLNNDGQQGSVFRDFKSASATKVVSPQCSGGGGEENEDNTNKGSTKTVNRRAESAVAR